MDIITWNDRVASMRSELETTDIKDREEAISYLSGNEDGFVGGRQGFDQARQAVLATIDSLTLEQSRRLIDHLDSAEATATLARYILCGEWNNADVLLELAAGYLSEEEN